MMSEALFPDSALVVNKLTTEALPEWATEEGKMKMDKNKVEEKINGDAKEPSTLPWPGDKAEQLEKMAKAASDKLEQETDTTAENASSDSMFFRGRESRTESERHLAEQEKRFSGAGYMAGQQLENIAHLEVEVEELNVMPQKAAGVFSPCGGYLRSSSMPNPTRNTSGCWVEEEEKDPLFEHQVSVPDGYYIDCPRHNKMQNFGCAGKNRDVLKISVSMLMSALIFPVLVWGGYSFLPFDAPLLDSAPLRLVYTLRCSVFAVIPIVLGVFVLGVSRVRYRSLRPQSSGEIEEVNIHRRYIDDSISLFLLHFLQLSVMAAYLSQNFLKLVPLLTIVFAFGRLVYWIAAAWGSSLRGFGFGLSLFPMLTMLVANLYFIFMTDSAGSIFAQEDLDTPSPPQEYKQRFWG